MATMAAILKICFQLFLRNWKASWLETSLEVSRCRVDQKWTKIVSIGNWLLWPRSQCSILNFYSWTIRQFDWKLGTIYLVTCRSQLHVAKIVTVGNSMTAILKIYFELLFLNCKANWLQTWYEVLAWLVDRKHIKSFRLDIQGSWHLFRNSSPEL